MLKHDLLIFKLFDGHGCLFLLMPHIAHLSGRFKMIYLDGAYINIVKLL
jgi:hypothetical protein